MKKVIFFGAIILCLIIINNLVHSIYDLWHKQDLVVKAQNDLQKEKEENQKLKSQLTIVGSDNFIEEQARDKLFMVKLGESGVILPPPEEKTEKKTVEIPNWQKWVNLFVGK